MAIATASASYIGTGPTVDQQALAYGGTGQQELVIIGKAVLTGDAGNSVAATINFIDGTAALPFTPSGVLVFRVVPASDTAAATVGTAPIASGITNKVFVVNFTTALGNGNTATYFFAVVK